MVLRTIFMFGSYVCCAGVPCSRQSRPRFWIPCICPPSSTWVPRVRPGVICSEEMTGHPVSQCRGSVWYLSNKALHFEIGIQIFLLQPKRKNPEANLFLPSIRSVGYSVDNNSITSEVPGSARALHSAISLILACLLLLRYE